MVLAWYFFGSVGIFTAKYLKKNFNDKKLLGKDMWFPIHQISMICTWLIALGGLAFMIVKDGIAPLKPERFKENPHALVGIISLSLMFIQPFMAFFRPHPDQKYRYIFNICHSLVGLSSYGLALAAIVLTSVPSFSAVILLEGSQILIIMGTSFFGMAHIIMLSKSESKNCPTYQGFRTSI